VWNIISVDEAKSACVRHLFTPVMFIFFQLGGTVVTYVVVMVQFSSPSSGYPTDGAEQCLRFTEMLN
jgi:hypothetical protein